MGRIARRPAPASALAVLLLALAAVGGSSAGVAGGTGAVLGELHAVDPIAAGNVWAVGSYWPNPSDRGDFVTLTERRIFGTWRRVTSPNPASTVVAGLLGVKAFSATNVWAVGAYNDRASGSDRTLIERWTGSSWRIVPSPNPGEFGNGLAAVDGVAGGDVWAVGYWGKPNLLILRWRGAGWKVVTAPDTSPFGEALTDVSARAWNDVWAVGYHVPDPQEGPRTLVLHWDGSTWSRVESPSPSEIDNELLGVAAVSERDAWAVGYETTSSGDRPLVLRWDGSAWNEVDVPGPNADSALSDVEAVEADDVWAVGSSGSNPVKPYVVRWDGASWTQVTAPSPTSPESVLLDVSARSATDVWAVGYYATSAGHRVLILHWDGTSWTLG